MCLWELTSRILGPSEGLWRTLQGTWSSTSFMLFLRHLSSFVLRVCMSPFGLQSIFRCHNKTVSHSWCSWDKRERGCYILPSVLLAPSPVKHDQQAKIFWLGKHISDATFKFIYLSFHLKLGRLSCSQYLSKEVSGNNDSPYRKVTTFTEEQHKLQYLFRTQQKRVYKELSHVTKSALTCKHNTQIKYSNWCFMCLYYTFLVYWNLPADP